MPSSGGHGFGKAWRIRRRKDYLRVQSQGARVHTSHFLLLLLENDLSHARVGITVSRKVGGAVVRNRVRRAVREVFRRHKDWFPPHHDVVVIAKRRAAHVSYHEIEDDLRKGRARLLRLARRSHSGSQPGPPAC